MGNKYSIRYPSVFHLNKRDKDWIEKTLSKMSLYEKCAQMVMPWVLGEYLSEDSSDYKRIEKLVKEYKVGGLIFFKGTILNEASIINRMQKIADIPLLIASDFERGLAMRLSDGLEFPYNMAVAAAGDSQLAYSLGKNIASECRALGVTQNYAPIADINNNPENPIINIRSFSEDKNIVSKFCNEFIKGTKANRVIATAKHFPGHGNTKIDSHKNLPTIYGSSKELPHNELLPFQQLINSGVQSIMVGHLSVPALDSSGIPATLSKPIITGLLKEKMGFEGLIVTDGMDMNAVTNNYSVAEATIKAIEAGIDLILLSPDEEISINAIYEAALSNVVNIDRINYSVRKILSAKKWLHLDQKKFIDSDKLTKIIGKRSHVELAEKIAEKSVTLVQNKKNIIPLNPNKFDRILCITITDEMETASDLIFQRKVEEKFVHVKKIILNKKSTASDYNYAFKAAAQAELIILPSFVKVKAFQGTVNLSRRNTSFINKLLNLTIPSILISFGNPYLLSAFPKAQAYLCAYGDAFASQTAMIKAIAGEIEINGKLPVTIPNTKYRIGDGIEIKSKLNI